jgi:hypothetical protein
MRQSCGAVRRPSQRRCLACAVVPNVNRPLSHCASDAWRRWCRRGRTCARQRARLSGRQECSLGDLTPSALVLHPRRHGELELGCEHDGRRLHSPRGDLWHHPDARWCGPSSSEPIPQVGSVGDITAGQNGHGCGRAVRLRGASRPGWRPCPGRQPPDQPGRAPTRAAGLGATPALLGRSYGNRGVWRCWTPRDVPSSSFTRVRYSPRRLRLRLLVDPQRQRRVGVADLLLNVGGVAAGREQQAVWRALDLANVRAFMTPASARRCVAHDCDHALFQRPATRGS